MKAIPWILVVVLGAGCLYLFSENNKKQAQLIELRQGASSGDGGESSGPASEDDIERLRRDAQEVYKLRGEIAQLKRDNQKLVQDLKDLGADDPTAMSLNDPLLDEFPPLTPEEEEQQKLELEHAIACVENLKTLEDAKTKWATENNKSGGDAVPMNEVMPYVPGQTMPLCPSGGTYVFNEVGVPTSCSVEGHSLLP